MTSSGETSRGDLLQPASDLERSGPEQAALTIERPIVQLRHIPALDGVRGLAVLIVFMFHWGGGTHSSFPPMKLFGAVNRGGWSGVTLFFVLSGFLITGILWDSYADPKWWPKFFARRSLRIFPLYYLVFAYLLLRTIPSGTFHQTLARIWIPAFFLQPFPSLMYESDHIRGSFHLWSIAVEEQFYLFWPFLLFLFRSNRQRARALCLTIFLLSEGVRCLIWASANNPPAWLHFLPVQAGALALGGWLALSFRGPEWKRILELAPWVGLAGVAGFLATGFAAHDFEAEGRAMGLIGLPLVTLFYAGLLTRATGSGLVAGFFSIRWLRALGNISYGFYVFHMLPGDALDAIVPRYFGVGLKANLAQFLMAAAFSLVMAILSYNLYEKQFLRLKKYFIPSTHASVANIVSRSVSEPPAVLPNVSS